MKLIDGIFEFLTWDFPECCVFWILCCIDLEPFVVDDGIKGEASIWIVGHHSLEELSERVAECVWQVRGAVCL